MLEDILSLNQILGLSPLGFAIDDLLPVGGILLLGGSPKAGKSLILLDLALRGVAEMPAFGRFAQRYKKALLVNVEGRHQGIKMRDPMFAFLPPELRERVVVSGKPLRFTQPTGAIAPMVFDHLKARIAKENIGLVALDPMVSFHSGDENNSQQMVAVLDALREVGDATRCAFIVVHHMRKLGSMQTLEQAIESGGDMLRGAGGIFGAVDSAVLVWTIGQRRLMTFQARYARGDLSQIEMQMDRATMRMYCIRNGVPDPMLWHGDNPTGGVGSLRESFWIGGGCHCESEGAGAVNHEESVKAWAKLLYEAATRPGYFNNDFIRRLSSQVPLFGESGGFITFGSSANRSRSPRKMVGRTN